MGEFVCEDPWYETDTYTFQNTNTQTDGVIFGEHIWVPDSDMGPSTAAAATVGRLDFPSTAGGDVWVADESDHNGNDALPDYSAAAAFDSTASPATGSWALYESEFNILGRFDVNWGIVVDREKGYSLWNTFGFDYTALTLTWTSLTADNGAEITAFTSYADANTVTVTDLTLDLIDW